MTENRPSFGARVYKQMVDGKEYYEKVAGLSIDYPALPMDTPSSCPLPVQAVSEYLSSAGEETCSSNLKFLRSALVDTHKYWIWRFDDQGGDECFAVVVVEPDETVSIGYLYNWFDLTPEQLIYGDFHGIIRS